MSAANEDRLADMESAIMHVQRDVETLSDSLIHHTKVLAELRKSIEKLTSSVESLESDADENRDPQSEKPPHY